MPLFLAVDALTVEEQDEMKADPDAEGVDDEVFSSSLVAQGKW